MTDGQTIRQSVACGIAAGVAHPATGAQLRPASAMSESVNRCKYGKSETVTLTSTEHYDSESDENVTEASL